MSEGIARANATPLSVALLIAAIFVPHASADDEKVHISDARSRDGILVHTATSPFQSGETEVRVLLPDRLDDRKQYPVIYVLPVQAQLEDRWGDGLLEVQKHDLHNKHGVICVAPTFSHLPWYCDHPTDEEIRQETYFLKVVIPFVEKTYPVSTKPEDRLLLGFSKSGWGAWTLLTRHSDKFSRAAAWDSPLMMTEIGRYGTSDILGTQANLEEYRLDQLLRANANKLRDQKRLILMGYGNFRDHHQQAHDLLNDLEIPHEYRDGPAREHRWSSGWVNDAVELLLKDSEADSD